MGLSFMSGIGAQVKDTVRSRNGFRPHTSERAPISGAARKDSIPWKQRSTSGNNGIIYQWSIVKNTKEGFSAPKFLEIKQFTPTFLTAPPQSLCNCLYVLYAGGAWTLFWNPFISTVVGTLKKEMEITEEATFATVNIQVGVYAGHTCT